MTKISVGTCFVSSKMSYCFCVNRVSFKKRLCSGSMRCLVIEELYLRNCFKQDYLLLQRCCWLTVQGPNDSMVHVARYSLLVKFVQQYEQKNADKIFQQDSCFSVNGSSESIDSVGPVSSSEEHIEDQSVGPS
jgi:hypothetical protein